MTPESKAVTQSQSLFRLEAELVELMQLREEMAEAGEDTAACDNQIQEYARRELKKVDGIRAYLANCEMMSTAAERESRRLKEISIMWDRRMDRLKDICKATMEFFCLKRIEGQTGSLLLKGNGGLAPLTITDESLVPDDLVDMMITMPKHQWLGLLKLAGINFFSGDIKLAQSVNHARVRAALKCGPVAGVVVGDRGSHLEIK